MLVDISKLLAQLRESNGLALGHDHTQSPRELLFDLDAADPREGPQIVLHAVNVDLEQVRADVPSGRRVELGLRRVDRASDFDGPDGEPRVRLRMAVDRQNDDPNDREQHDITDDAEDALHMNAVLVALQTSHIDRTEEPGMRRVEAAHE